VSFKFVATLIEISAASSVKNVVRQKVAIIRQTAANFRQEN